MTSRAFGLALITLLLLVSACTPFGAESVSCETLSASELHTFIRTRPTSEALRAWVEAKHPGVEITAYEGAVLHGVTSMSWDEGQRRWRAIFNEEGVTKFVEAKLEDTTVTLAQVEECLGAPDLFSVDTFSGWYGREVNLHVWYPEEGIRVIFGRQHVRTERIHLSRDFQAQEISYVNSDNIESGVAMVDSYPSDERLAKILESLTPWREDIESVEVGWE